MSKSRDIDRGLPPTGTRPLNARSLALSALLGTHPPTLSAGALVDLAQVFGIHAGTMRTALSRMVHRGDVVSSDGLYTLAPRLLDRQVAQDAGRSPADTAWDGSWHVAVATVDQRELAERRLVRSVMDNARFGELRPSVWLRPANLPTPALGTDWVVTTGPLLGTASDVLARRLWNLPLIADEGRRLTRRIESAESTLDPATSTSLPGAFSLSAEVVRFLRSEPLLPSALTPPEWPIDDLRRRYDRFEDTVQAMLRPILTGAR